METIVKLKYIKQSAKKIRFVLNDIRGAKVSRALNKLDKLNKKAAFSIAKAIRSGLSNLTSNNIDDNFNQEDYYIDEAYVDQGPVMKRFRPAAMGRATPILKRSSHLTLKLKKNSTKN
tara:strand:- start:732 stop:1085 length:354 start_codon:yes stop_codon:yes gene_type:complete